MTAKTNIARQRRGDVIDINDRTNIRKHLMTNTVSNIATTPRNTKQQGKGGGIPFNEYDKYIYIMTPKTNIMTTLGIPNTKLKRGNIIKIEGKYEKKTFYDKYHELESGPKNSVLTFSLTLSGMVAEGLSPAELKGYVHSPTIWHPFKVPGDKLLDEH